MQTIQKKAGNFVKVLISHQQITRSFYFSEQFFYTYQGSLKVTRLEIKICIDVHKIIEF